MHKVETKCVVPTICQDLVENYGVLALLISDVAIFSNGLEFAEFARKMTLGRVYKITIEELDTQNIKEYSDSPL